MAEYRIRVTRKDRSRSTYLTVFSPSASEAVLEGIEEGDAVIDVCRAYTSMEKEDKYQRKYLTRFRRGQLRATKKAKTRTGCSTYPIE